MPLSIPARSKILFSGDSITDCGRPGASAQLLDGDVRMAVDFCWRAIRSMIWSASTPALAATRSAIFSAAGPTRSIGHQPDWLSLMIGINDLTGGSRKTQAVTSARSNTLTTTRKSSSGEKRDQGETCAHQSFLPIDRPRSQSYRRRVLDALPAYQQTVRVTAERHKAYFVDFHAMFERLLKQWPTDRFGPKRSIPTRPVIS